MKTFAQLCVTFLLAQQLNAADGTGWFYAAQKEWGTDYPDCDKEQQSPINIEAGDTVHDADLDTPWTLSDNFFTVLEEVVCKNEGQTYKCTLTDGTTAARTIEGGGLIKAPLKLLQFHFHWGSSTSHFGSEHTMNGKQYPAEMHFVFETQDSTNNDMTTDYGTLAVWGFFIDIDDNSATGGSLASILTAISDNLGTYEEEQTLTNAVDLTDILPLNFQQMKRFYRYKGSLTTPQCYETVQWTVFQDPLTISSTQYDKLLGGQTWGPAESMVNNFRAVHPLGDRYVTRTQEAHGGSSGLRGLERSLLVSVFLVSAAKYWN